MRQLANDLADRVLAASDGESRTAMLADFASHAQDMTFATQLLYRLRDGSQNAGKALIWLEGELEKRGIRLRRDHRRPSIAICPPVM